MLVATGRAARPLLKLSPMTPRTLRSSLALTFLAVSVALFGGASSAHADDDEVAKLEAHGKALRYTVPTTAPSSSIDTGGAAVVVHAPLPVVRSIVTSYGRYKDYVPTFEQSRLIGKKDGESEVYFDVPVLNGAAHVWAVLKMGKPVTTADGEVIRGRFVKGNVDDFRTIWRLKKIDEQRTLVKLEILVDPDLPLPASLVTHHLREAAYKGASAVKKEGEKRVGYVAPAPAPVASSAPAAPPEEAEVPETPEEKPPANVAKR